MAHMRRYPFLGVLSAAPSLPLPCAARTLGMSLAAAAAAPRAQIDGELVRHFASWSAGRINSGFTALARLRRFQRQQHQQQQLADSDVEVDARTVAAFVAWVDLTSRDRYAARAARPRSRSSRARLPSAKDAKGSEAKRGAVKSLRFNRDNMGVLIDPQVCKAACHGRALEWYPQSAGAPAVAGAFFLQASYPIRGWDQGDEHVPKGA